jgi:hypothetical protein
VPLAQGERLVEHPLRRGTNTTSSNPEGTAKPVVPSTFVV